MDSSNYNSQWYTNPPFPFDNETFYTDVNLGAYLLDKSQFNQLFNTSAYRPNEDEQNDIINATADMLSEKGYEPLAYDNNNFVCRLAD